MILYNDWTFESDSVQGYWNKIENKLVSIIDIVVPIKQFTNNYSTKSSSTPAFIKKLYRLKGLLKKLKREFKQDWKNEIKYLDKIIKNR
jgi:hypothetical protein